MSDTKTNKAEEQQSNQSPGLQFERRDIIKGLAAVPAMPVSYTHLTLPPKRIV